MVAVFSGFGLLLALCGPSVANASASAGTANLVFWDWQGGLNRDVQLFNKTHPHIHVTLADVGTNQTDYSKLADALKSGKGVPDVAEIEYHELPSFEISHNFLDLSKYGAAKYSGDFPAWVWSEVKSGGQVYAMPFDTGPMATLYNAKTLAKDKLSPPTTWAQFASDAAVIHKDDPNQYITDFNPGNLEWLLGLMQQARAFPFKYRGGKDVTIDFTGKAQTAFADYWQSLMSKHEVLYSVAAASTTTFWQQMDNDQDVINLAAAWEPQFQQPNMKTSLGDWRVSAFPQWTAGADVGAIDGGSAFAVLNTTKYPAQAATFAEWMTATTASWNVAWTPPTLVFPGLKSELKQSSFLNATIALTGPQKEHQPFVSAVKTATAAEWPPFMTEALTASADAFAPAQNGKETMKQAFASFQKTLVSYARSEGFEVKT
jgi:multiple sugar transport system substrate-binding protein